MHKGELRREIRARRRRMSREEWTAGSERVCRRIQGLRQYEEAELVCAYLAMRGEVLLDGLIEDAWRRGKQVAVPRVLGQEMLFYRLESLEAVEISPLGIREPVAALPGSGPPGEWKPAEPDGRALFLVPGVAFDRQLNRVGQGGGYYDRYLEKRPAAFKLGVAFAFQLYPYVPAEEFDVKLDGIAVESGVYMPDGFHGVKIPFDPNII